MTPPKPIRHGWSRYCRHGCRCDVCRTAATKYRAARKGPRSRVRNTLGIPAWMDAAACIGKATDVFFPLPGGDTSISYSRARDICSGCDVSAECAAFADTENIQHGMWGGLTPEERRVHLNARQTA